MPKPCVFACLFVLLCTQVTACVCNAGVSLPSSHSAPRGARMLGVAAPIASGVAAGTVSGSAATAACKCCCSACSLVAAAPHVRGAAGPSPYVPSQCPSAASPVDVAMGNFYLSRSKVLCLVLQVP